MSSARRPSPKPGGDSSAICFKCGQKGHISPNCPNSAKRQHTDDTNNVDEWDDSWWDYDNDCWHEAEDDYDDQHQNADQSYMIIETRPDQVLGATADDFMEGCLILDSGASLSVLSLKAADAIPVHRIERDEPGGPPTIT